MCVYRYAEKNLKELTHKVMFSVGGITIEDFFGVLLYFEIFIM